MTRAEPRFPPLLLLVVVVVVEPAPKLKFPTGVGGALNDVKDPLAAPPPPPSADRDATAVAPPPPKLNPPGACAGSGALSKPNPVDVDDLGLLSDFAKEKSGALLGVAPKLKLEKAPADLGFCSL